MSMISAQCDELRQNELHELTKDAPNFAQMERGELVAYAYGLFAAGNKVEAENAKLRCLVLAWSKLYDMAPYANHIVETMVLRGRIDEMMRDLDFAPADEVEE